MPLAGAGGFALGWNIGYLASHKKSKPWIWGAGAGAVALSLTFSILADKFAGDAIKGYNLDLKSALGLENNFEQVPRKTDSSNNYFSDIILGLSFRF